MWRAGTGIHYSWINSQANCCGTFPQNQVRANKFSCPMQISGGEVNAVQGAGEARWF
jgi:hypothetical protein